MKTKISFFALLLVLLFFSSCVNDDPYYPPVVSCFETDYAEYKMGEEIRFWNCSAHASSFVWDFGDGFQSEVFEPHYHYTTPGIYTVSLTAYGFDGSVQTSTLKLKILAPPTRLAVRVFYFNTTDPVSDCLVSLFETEQDYVDLTNPLAEARTNIHGDVEFSGLETYEYFVDAYKKSEGSAGYYTNWDLGFVVGPLEPYVINYYDIYVAYAVDKRKGKTLKIVDAQKRLPPRR